LTQPQTPVYGAYAPPPQPTPMQPPPSNPLDLAALLRGASFPPAPQQQYQNPMAPPPPPPFQAQNPPQPPPVMFPGLEALFKLPGFQQAAPQMQQYQALARVMPPQVYQPPPMIPNLAQALTQAQTSAPTPSQSFASLNGLMANPSNDVQLTSASLKLPRPHLLRSLYNHVPSQCLTCGRRFAADAEGKSRKARHLDAHFRTNTRLADAQRRGVSRSWFLDELDWIRSREIDDADEDIDTATKGDGNAGVDAASKVVADAGSDLNRGGTGGQTAGIKEYYVKAPADAAVAHHACPICQEEFKTVWHDGAQEWVWMDATIQGEKTYHASCVLEMARDGNQGGVKREY
jgi:pre-mRNA cleavage complex 2 protein Pcf11